MACPNLIKRLKVFQEVNERSFQMVQDQKKYEGLVHVKTVVRVTTMCLLTLVVARGQYIHPARYPDSTSTIQGSGTTTRGNIHFRISHEPGFSRTGTGGAYRVI